MKKDEETGTPPVYDGQSEQKEQAEEEILLQHLSFRLNKDLYAIEIDYVKEVIEDQKIFPVPRTPQYISGVTNLRGEVIPIIDLYPFFFSRKPENEDISCIIFLELEQNEKKQIIGLLVSEILSVMNIAESKIKQATDIGTRIPFEYVKSIADFENEFYTILDTERMLKIEHISDFTR